MIEELKRYAAFREQLRDWLRANLPADWKQRMRGASEEQHVEFQKFWFRKMK